MPTPVNPSVPRSVTAADRSRTSSSSLASRSVSVWTSCHPANARLKDHQHSNAYLSFVIAGEYVESVGGVSVPCATYRVRFHPPGEVHADSFGPRGAHCLNLELDERWNEHIAELGLTDPCDALVVDTAVWMALRAWREVQQPGEFSTLALEEIAAAMLARCTGARREAHALRSHTGIRRAVAFVRESAEGPVTLRDAAAAAGLHPTHLARVFRARMGCTLGDYIRRVRAVRALDDMQRHLSWSLSRVAAESGFADHPHLSRVFAETFGASPSDVRRATPHSSRR